MDYFVVECKFLFGHVLLCTLPLQKFFSPRTSHHIMAFLEKVRIAHHLERFFPVVSVLTYYCVCCGTSAVKITLSNALSELLHKSHYMEKVRGCVKNWWRCRVLPPGPKYLFHTASGVTAGCPAVLIIGVLFFIFKSNLLLKCVKY